jgi:flavin reductase (DIM6/NTAB) family NADH-FMN oxidoreductase RutF
MAPAGGRVNAKSAAESERDVIAEETVERLIDFRRPGAWSKGFREALGRFVTGVTIMTTRSADGALHGLTVNSFSALSLEPPLILWSLRNEASTFEAFTRAERFVVNVLCADQEHLSRRFAIAGAERFAGLDWAGGLGGCPIIPGCIARFECQTERLVPGGDHIVLIGRVERAAHRDGEPLLFHAGRYYVPVPIDPASAESIPESMYAGLTIEPNHFF